eukprot:Lankesteria_metandrocarpae@DN1011_c0_g1_i1.p1
MTGGARTAATTKSIYDVVDAGGMIDDGDDEADRLEFVNFRRHLGKLPASISSLTLSDPAQLAVERDKITPVPRIKWTRKKRNPHDGGWNAEDEKVVYIYGETNILKFFAWRAYRVPKKRTRDSALYSPVGGVLGTASRMCRRCGQVGHISSNPICPMYTGPRSKVAKAASATVVSARRRKAETLLPSGLDGIFVDSMDADAAAAAMPATQLGAQQQQTTTQSPKPEVTTSDCQSATGSATGSNTAAKNHNRPKVSARLTPRQRAALEKKGTLVGGVDTKDLQVENFKGTTQKALEELNQILHRIILSTRKGDRNWNLFFDKIDERLAPGYYDVIKSPVWLELMISKCKDRQYKVVEEFTADLELMVANCYHYNPEGHWIRPLVDSLNEFFKTEIANSTLLTEVDRFLREKHDACAIKLMQQHH